MHMLMWPPPVVRHHPGRGNQSLGGCAGPGSREQRSVASRRAFGSCAAEILFENTMDHREARHLTCFGQETPSEHSILLPFFIQGRFGRAPVCLEYGRRVWNCIVRLRSQDHGVPWGQHIHQGTLDSGYVGVQLNRRIECELYTLYYFCRATPHLHEWSF
ncbi:hypothetical protein BDW22DRAFT_334920 [Trametopsis cervina]|nr:hypothetical protein BDW22DRAFT_334920 [Trametopsis cervina]